MQGKRRTRPVRYLIDHTARPPRRYEAVTGLGGILAFCLGRTWGPDGELSSGMWGVIRRGAPADAEPAWMSYDRAEALPWQAGGERHFNMAEAMKAAAPEAGPPALATRARRWVTPEGLIIDLTHLTHTSRNLGQAVRGGGTWDGWVLITRHPDSRVVLGQFYFGAEVPEERLAAELAAIHAVPLLDTATTQERNHHHE